MQPGMVSLSPGLIASSNNHLHAVMIVEIAAPVSLDLMPFELGMVVLADAVVVILASPALEPCIPIIRQPYSSIVCML